MSTSIENTDRELWREREGDYYADFNCGGRVIVKPLKAWHELGMFESEVDAITAQPMSRGVAEVIAGRVVAADKIADLQSALAASQAELADLKGYINGCCEMIPGVGLLAIKITAIVDRAEASQAEATRLEAELSGLKKEGVA